MMDERFTLPISQTQDHILDMIQRNPVVVIRGETGSGKTTQVPQYILDSYIESGRGAECNIIITQVGLSQGYAHRGRSSNRYLLQR